ncbi:hypothetical protein GWI33_017415 [Rhynchophorus ferrugineus]|uniref:Gustatory receptor n=1 Tax=Rhynchophorus ferrugineus TaxID=354439 RepID=A0A834J199_RHYFE|nr:hypothetical protein GWI33_017415 [Rhynchophorus ferrugineus]
MDQKQFRVLMMMFIIILLARKADQVVQEAKRTSNISYKLYMTYPMNTAVLSIQSCQDKLLLMSRHSVISSVSFNIMNVFYLDGSLIYGIMNISCGYLLVLIQLK